MSYADPFVKDRFVAMLARHEALLGNRLLMVDQYLKNDKAARLGVRVAAGARQGLTVTKSEYVVECAPGTVFTKPLLVSGSAVVAGAIFEGRGDDPLISVLESGSLLLVNCLLVKDGLSSGSYISVSAG